MFINDIIASSSAFSTINQNSMSTGKLTQLNVLYMDFLQITFHVHHWIYPFWDVLPGVLTDSGKQQC